MQRFRFGLGVPGFRVEGLVLLKLLSGPIHHSDVGDECLTTVIHLDL